MKTGGGAGGGNNGGSKSGGNGMGSGVEETIIPEECISLRYYPGEIDVAVVKPALARVKGVQKVEIDAKLHLVLVTWKGKCKGINQLETAAASVGVPAYLVNHSHVYAALKTARGSNLDELWNELFDVAGVKGSIITGGQIEIHCDLQDLSLSGMRKVAKKSGVELDFTSHNWIEPSLTGGDAQSVADSVVGLKGVLFSRVKEEKLGFWALKSVKDEQMKATIEKAGATCGELKRP